MEQWGKWLVSAGITIVLVGLLLWLGGDKLSWIGRLPGDIRIERGHFRFYFPITTLILINLVILAVWWLIKKVF